MHFMPEYNESILEFYSYVKHKKNRKHFNKKLNQWLWLQVSHSLFLLYEYI